MSVHLVGNHIKIGSRVIQRCLVCGFKLVDIDTAITTVVFDAGDSAEHLRITFEPLSLIEVTETEDYTEFSILDVDATAVFSDPWENSCITLVEEGIN